MLGLRTGQRPRLAHSQFSERRRSHCGMDAAAEIRGIPWRLEWRNHRHAARLPLQLDGGLALDEQRWRRSSALHRYRGLRDQTATADAVKRTGFFVRENYRINR